MSNLFDDYKIEFDLSVRLPIYDELDYVNPISGKIYHWKDNKNEYDLCGQMLCYLINLKQILEDGLNRFEMLDAYSADLLTVSKIFSSKPRNKYGFFTKQAFEALGVENELFCSSQANFIYIEILEILPRHRGKGVGPFILNETLAYLAKTMQIEFFVMIPAPLQHTYGVFDEGKELDAWKKRLALHKLEKDKKSSLKRLQQIYSELGFNLVKGTELMVCPASDFM